jgi:hypothetical protein
MLYRKMKKPTKMYLTRIFTIVFLDLSRETFETSILSNFFNRTLFKRLLGVNGLCQKVDLAKNISWTYITLCERHTSFWKLQFETNYFNIDMLTFINGPVFNWRVSTCKYFTSTTLKTSIRIQTFSLSYPAQPHWPNRVSKNWNSLFMMTYWWKIRIVRKRP